MSRFPIRCSLAALALAAALSCTKGVPYSQVASTMPAPVPGQGRILFYMTTSDAEAGGRPALSLDGETLGVIAPGTFFYVDRPAGPHQISLPPAPGVPGSESLGSALLATVFVDPGRITYVQVSVIVTVGSVKVVATPEDFADAQRDLSTLDLVMPERP